MNIIIDTREKYPWKFTFNDYITGIKNMKLDAGDYSIAGHEELVSIERKRNVLELADNFVADRFWKAIIRLQEVRHSVIVVEATLDEFYRFPQISSIPANLRDKLQLTPQFLISKINEIISDGIPIIFAGNTVYAERFANDFLCKIIKKYKLC